jgi:hypothetical protein
MAAEPGRPWSGVLSPTLEHRNVRTALKLLDSESPMPLLVSGRAVGGRILRLLTLAGVLLAGPAVAQTTVPASSAPAPSSDSSTAPPDPKSLFSAGLYANAYAEFAASYDKTADARLLWNMAACQTKLGSYAKALSLLRGYLASSGRSPDEQHVARALIERLTALVSKLRITVNEPGAAVIVDGEVAGTAPVEPIEVDAGDHHVLVRKTGFAPAEAPVQTTRGAETGVDVKLRKVRRSEDAWWRLGGIDGPIGRGFQVDAVWGGAGGGPRYVPGVTGAPRTSPGRGVVAPSGSRASSTALAAAGSVMAGLAAVATVYALTHWNELQNRDTGRDRPSPPDDRPDDRAASDTPAPAPPRERQTTTDLRALDVLK